MVRQQAEIQNGLVVDTRTASAECEMAIFAESGPTLCPSAAASALSITFKMQMISRAKRSAAWACWVADGRLLESDVTYYNFRR